MNQLQYLLALQPAFALQIIVHVFDKIKVGEIAQVTIGDEYILPAIQVIISE